VLFRDYWGIENRLHYVRDVTLGEDLAQIRCGAAPQAMAVCRNLTLALLRRAGVTNVAEALRTHAGRPRAAATLVPRPPSSSATKSSNAKTLPTHGGAPQSCASQPACSTRAFTVPDDAHQG